MANEEKKIVRNRVIGSTEINLESDEEFKNFVDLINNPSKPIIRVTGIMKNYLNNKHRKL